MREKGSTLVASENQDEKLAMIAFTGELGCCGVDEGPSWLCWTSWPTDIWLFIDSVLSARQEPLAHLLLQCVGGLYFLLRALGLYQTSGSFPRASLFRER